MHDTHPAKRNVDVLIIDSDFDFASPPLAVHRIECRKGAASTGCPHRADRAVLLGRLRARKSQYSLLPFPGVFAASAVKVPALDGCLAFAWQFTGGRAARVHRQLPGVNQRVQVVRSEGGIASD